MAEIQRCNWSDSEVRKLLAVNLEDPATWPDYMADYRARESGCKPAYAASVIGDAAGLRRLILAEAGERRLVNELAYVRALVDALWSRLPHNTPEWHMLFNLESAIYGLFWDGLQLGAEIGPEVRARVVDPEEILSAVGAPKAA